MFNALRRVFGPSLQPAVPQHLPQVPFWRHFTAHSISPPILRGRFPSGNGSTDSLAGIFPARCALESCVQSKLLRRLRISLQGAFGCACGKRHESPRWWMIMVVIVVIDNCLDAVGLQICIFCGFDRLVRLPSHACNSWVLLSHACNSWVLLSHACNSWVDCTAGGGQGATADNFLRTLRVICFVFKTNIRFYFMQV